jgi:serine/threonine-protein kinase
MRDSPGEDSPRGALENLLAGRYVIDRELGRGGMGAVYLARDTRLDRAVALKVLPPECAAVPSSRERFLRESRLAAGFSHPNIVPVYAVEESSELLTYVMAFVEGETLAERVRRAGPLGPRETLRVLQDVAYALAFAHGHGVVHRDIKPDNVMIERATGRALVMDFGVARAIAPGPADSDGEGLTRVGEIVGTPEYMSPEQATGDAVDGRSDLYSLGLTVYFALTGDVVMSAETTGKVLARQLTQPVPVIRSVRRDVPVALADAVERCVSKDPADRFADAASLIAALDAAHLAEPEIPVAIRAFAQSLGTLSLLVTAGALLLYVVIRAELKSGTALLDALIPLVVVLSVFGARALQVFGEARQLAVTGFNGDAVRRGLVAVMNEHAARREELRMDRRVQRARRRAIMTGASLMTVAPALGFAALGQRTQLGPDYYQTTLLGVALAFTAFAAFPVGALLVARSPFRMPVGEWLFRRVWTGPTGSFLLRLACRGIPDAGCDDRSAGAGRQLGSTTLEQARSPVSLPPDVTAPGRLQDLEARVSALERWRDGRR